MKLYKLINGIAETALEDMEISGITDNTSKVREGFIFVCVRGASFDGHSAAERMLE